MKKHLLYLRYVLRHKWFVFQECLKLGVPLWIAIIHDWDKFLPFEFLSYAEYFYGDWRTRKKSYGEFTYGDGVTEESANFNFNKAWMHHQHRNKHHWQYWLKIQHLPIQRTMYMVEDSGKVFRVGNTGYKEIDGMFPIASNMNNVSIREMVADWRGAGKALNNPDTVKWYQENKNKMILHDSTRKEVERLLGI